MQRGGGAPLVKLAVATDRLVGVQALDRDVAPPKLGDRRRIWTQPAVRSDAEDQPLRQLVEHLIEILKRERVSIAAPPVGHDPVGQHDQIPRLL